MATHTINLGKVDYHGTGRRNCAVTVDVSYDGDKFSACAFVWNPRKTDCYVGGQCFDSIARFFKDGEYAELFGEIYDLWSKWHLNDRHAGTAEQEAFVEELPEYVRRDYRSVCELLDKAGLYEVELDGEPYRYGTKWLKREIAPEDKVRIENLMAA